MRNWFELTLQFFACFDLFGKCHNVFIIEVFLKGLFLEDRGEKELQVWPWAVYTDGVQFLCWDYALCVLAEWPWGLLGRGLAGAGQWPDPQLTGDGKGFLSGSHQVLCPAAEKAAWSFKENHPL